MPDKLNIAILGGTEQVHDLLLQYASHKIILCLAGRTTHAGEKFSRKNITVRIGGFGGADGLATWLVENKIDLLIDATHPFATKISQNAILATRDIDTKLKVITRPKWQKLSKDNWLEVADIRQAVTVLPKYARAFLALGHQHIAPFAEIDDIVVRQMDAPAKKINETWQYIIAPPSLDVASEVKLFQQYKISHLVCRNSGGEKSYAKIVAARKLNITVIIIDR